MKEIIEINTNEDSLIQNQEDPDYQNSSSDKIDEKKQEQDQNKLEIIDLNIKNTNAQTILEQYEDYKDEIIFSEPFIEFNIKLKSVDNYEWKVYRKANEIQPNFEDIISELDKKNINPKADIRSMLTQISNWGNDLIPINIGTIKYYYLELFKDDNIINTLAFKEFFNISSASFNPYNKCSKGQKPFEGWGYKKADPHCLRKAFSYICYCIEYFAFAQYNLRWVVLTDDHIYYMKNSKEEKGKHLYFFDSNTFVDKQEEKQIKITNSPRSLILTFKTVFERNLWYYEIKKRIDNKKKILKDNPYGAYTNMKSGNQAQWFADGEKYFADLAENLKKAEVSIFITDWFLSPEVWLVRPVSMNQNTKDESSRSRLMDILYERATTKDVKIYIQIYAENHFILPNNSNYVKNTLEALHPNIKVLRHPLYIKSALWSHHEKLVIIDQSIAYIGGLDLCWGRFDTNEHPINEPRDNSNDPKYLFPGIDYSNARIRDFKEVENYLKESSIRGIETRMPWHDVHCRIIGPAVIDIARHFVERWNFTTIGTRDGITEIKQSDSSIISTEEKEDGLLAWCRQVLNNGKDKDNKYEPLISNEDEEKKEIIDENEDIYEENENKSSEEEINTKLNGKHNNDDDEEDKELEDKRKRLRESMKKYDLKEKEVIKENYFNIDKDNDDENESKKLIGKKSNNLIEEDNEINTDSKLINENNNNNNQEIKKPPPFYTKLINNASKSKFFKKLIGKKVEEKEKLENTIINKIFFMKGKKNDSDVQVLRSSSKWSAGIKNTENSILQAYIKLIQEAEHYIYIENQFFVSKSYDENDKKNCKYKDLLPKKIKNTIAYEIRKRIIDAYKNNKKFRVIVFLPLLPGFPGEPKESTLQIIMRYTYQAICRNYKTSIIEKLEAEMGEKWKDYIGFYSLRGHGLVNGIPKTEIIYIHSKLMIVDDKKVIIGSANINDRSMLGDRDSEFCVLIHEKERNNFIIDGQKTKASNFAHSFRTNLMAEHLGLDINNENDKKILNDPLSNDLWSMLINRAKNNTEIYRKVFYCYPDDNMKTFDQVPEKLKEEKLDELKKLYDEEKDNIKGHIVEFPLHFLEREELGIPFFSKEKIVPEKTYT